MTDGQRYAAGVDHEEGLKHDSTICWIVAAIAQTVKASREATIQECVGAVERWRDNAGPPTVEGKYDTYGYGLSCATQAIKELGFDIKIPYPPKMA